MRQYKEQKNSLCTLAGSGKNLADNGKNSNAGKWLERTL